MTDTFEAFKWLPWILGLVILSGWSNWLSGDDLRCEQSRKGRQSPTGKTTCSEVEFGKSTWIVIPSEEGKASGFTPQVGDLNYLQSGKQPLMRTMVYY